MTQLRVHIVTEKFVQGLGLVKDVWKALSNVIKGKALYQSVILTLELVKEKMFIVD